MKKILILALALTIIAPACKKKDDPAPSSTTSTSTTGGTTGSTTGGTTGSSTTGGTSTGGTTTGGTTGTGTFTNATTFHGIMTTGISTGNFGGFPFTASSAQAYFSSAPVTMPDMDSGIEIQSVLLNGDSLEYQDSSFMYVHTNPFGLNVTTESWKINGNSTIPTFTISNTGSRPSGLNSSALPTSVSKASGLTLNLGTLANIKAGSFVLSDGTQNLNGTIIIPLQNGPNTISLTAAQLSGLTKGSNGAIAVMLENSQAIHILGKNFNFMKQLQAVSMVTISD
jgi:hypothetical protein